MDGPAKAAERRTITARPTVLIVHGHPLTLNALATVLESAGMDVVARVSTIARLEAIWRREKPDVVVISDSVTSRLDGIVAAASLVRAHPAARILVYGFHSEQRVLLAALEAGVAGYVSAGATIDDTVTAVHDVAAGRAGYDPATATELVSALRGKPDNVVQPTEREWEVLVALCNGVTSTKALAAELNMGAATVKTHVASLEAKMGVHDRAAVVGAAHRTGVMLARRLKA